METSKAHSNSTQLKDRTLWYDGDSSVPADKILDLVMDGVSVNGLYVEEITPEITQYNSFVQTPEQIVIKNNVQLEPIEWVLPDEYDAPDPIMYVTSQLLKQKNKYSPEEFELRTKRIVDELVIYEAMELLDVLSVLIFIINTFQHNNVVWGVGRGSSVSSYVLYLIGVHDVDSYAYDLDIDDFLH